tara:strand:- start:709 stop:1062 length:354 start_codon:yes stop_codon:yes gene_type:complete
MRVCEVCGMATNSGICLTCGTEENENNISGLTDTPHNQESQKTILPFDLQESSPRKLETPIFGLEASPEYNQKEKKVANGEKSSIFDNIPFGIKDAPKSSLTGGLIFGLSDSPDNEE